MKNSDSFFLCSIGPFLTNVWISGSWEFTLNTKYGGLWLSIKKKMALKILLPQNIAHFDIRSLLLKQLNCQFPCCITCPSYFAEAKMCQMSRLLCERQIFLKLGKLNPGPIINTHIVCLPDIPAKLVSQLHSLLAFQHWPNIDSKHNRIRNLSSNLCFN